MYLDSPIFNLLLKYTCLSKETLIKLIHLSATSYKKYKIPKKNGRGMRQICQPSKETKMLQYYLLDNVFATMPIHPSAFGYVKGKASPLRKNAEMHRSYKYSVHLDYTDFFPSIVPSDLLDTPNFEGFTSEDKEIIEKICFMSDKDDLCLTIGAPVSPIISNIVMYEIDVDFDHCANDFGGVYTRYADDLWYSSNNQDSCKSFAERGEHQTKYVMLSLSA